jgi:hypothetical protein
MEDNRDVLKTEKPFSYRITKDNKAIIYWNNKQIMIINKKIEILRNLEIKNDEYGIQLFLAKITGHFKHGNERH